MKKQILFLAIFTLAIFASTGEAFGQLAPSYTSTEPITPLSCIATSEPLHPFAGVSYKYALTGDAGEEKADSYTWWATKSPLFISAPVDITDMSGSNFSDRLASPDVYDVSTNYGATTAASTADANIVSITWGAGILAATKYKSDATGWATANAASPTPTYVVGYAEGVLCADNIQVFEINPLPNFTIDITAIDPSNNTTPMGWDINTATTCVDVVQSATYNNTSFELDMNYGTNTIYYEVAAANFVNDWTPTFQILSGLATTQTAVISMYSTLGDATGTGTALWTSASLAVADMNTPIGTAKALGSTLPADISTGVSVFVKVVITNNREESLTSSPFALAVDAIDNAGGGIWDMDNDDCGVDPTTIIQDQDDNATITVTPRPQLDDATTPETLPNPDAPIIKTITP